MVSSGIDPYRYPKSRHRRTQDPPQYRDYRSYKRWLRHEFNGQCVYCRRPDSFHPDDHKSFAVEHFRPKSKFQPLKCAYSNLFYVCANCNSNKGGYWPRVRRDPMLINPCDDVMTEHVKFNRSKVLSSTTRGEFFAVLLRLNDPELVEHRSTISLLVGRTVAELQKARALLAQLQELVNRGVQVDPDDLKQVRLQCEHHDAILRANAR